MVTFDKKYLIIGRTGVGKSSFINAVLSRNMTLTSAYEPCTKIVQHYILNTNLGDIYLIDTPGLGEGDIDMDIRYLNLIKKFVNIGELRYVIYITRLDETRLRSDEMQAIQAITEHLSSTLFCNAMLVLTFASNISKKNISEQTKQRISSISEFIKTCCSNKGVMFNGFKKIWIMDSVVHNWSKNATNATQAIKNL